MKKSMQTLLLTLMLTAFCYPTFAQNSPKRPFPNPCYSGKQCLNREQMAEVQAKHIAHEIALDDATSQRFVNTFCKYQQEIWALGSQPKKKCENLTEEETKQMLKQRFEHSRKILELREKYYGIYSEFLTQKQIQRVFQLENRLMRHLTKRHANRPRNQGRQSPKINNQL